MFETMGKLTSGILLALPAAAFATPIYVEYDTYVTHSCCEGGPYAPGDRVAGWLRIDSELAPPDRFAANPGSQVHAQYWAPDGPDFISGIGWPGVPFGDDEVSVIDDSERFSHQEYAVWDYSNNPTGGTTILQLQIFSNDRVDDFIHGKELAQSFDTADMEGDIGFIGRITHELKGVKQVFQLALGRLSATPGHCRAP
jgi:hypothetical protein